MRQPPIEDPPPSLSERFTGFMLWLFIVLGLAWCAIVVPPLFLKFMADRCAG